MFECNVACSARLLETFYIYTSNEWGPPENDQIIVSFPSVIEEKEGEGEFPTTELVAGHCVPSWAVKDIVGKPSPLVKQAQY